jgi:AraC-like DNA-binding protein
MFCMASAKTKQDLIHFRAHTAETLIAQVAVRLLGASQPKISTTVSWERKPWNNWNILKDRFENAPPMIPAVISMHLSMQRVKQIDYFDKSNVDKPERIWIHLSWLKVKLIVTALGHAETTKVPNTRIYLRNTTKNSCVIQNRTILEARRLLCYSDKSIKEIATK